MPKDGGKWDPPNARETGNGKWTFTDPNGTERTVEFVDGYPDFKPFVKGGGPYHLDNVTGNVSSDRTALFNQYPDQFPGRRQPPNTTLHHLEDGTVAFVDSSVHDNVSHTGFRSVQNTDLF